MRSRSSIGFYLASRTRIIQLARVLPGGIRARLFLLITLTLLPVLLLLGWIYYQRYHALHANALSSELEVAQGISATFNAYVDDVRRQNHAAGQAIIKFSPYNESYATQVLRSAAEHYRTIRNLSWVSPAGRVLASSLPAMLGGDMSAYPFFQQIISGQPWTISDLTARGMITNAPTVAIATAIRDQRGELRGVVVASIEPTRLGELALTQRRPADAAYAIFDRQGALVYRTPETPLIWEQRARWRQSDPLLARTLETGQAQTGVTLLEAPASGDWFSARVPINEMGWVAGAGRSVEATLAPIRRALLQDGVLALLVFALAFAMAYLIARTIARPLLALERDARAMGAGRPVAQGGSALQAPTEVVRLRETVEQMAAGLLRHAAVLRQSEQRLRATFDNAAVGIVEIDADDHFIAVNDRICQILGYRREDLLGMSVHELTAQEDRPRSIEFNTQLHEGRCERLDYEKHYLRKDGSSLWAHVTASAIRDTESRFQRSIGTIEDISQRKAAEEQLRLQAKALEAAANGIIITDAGGTILWANRAFAEMSGYNLQETIGRNSRMLNSGKQDKIFYQALWETIGQGEIWHGELVNRRKDGALYHEEMTIAPVVDEHGAISHYIAIKQDISERKRAEERIQLANAQLAEADRRKDEFLAMLAHELRNPLAPVRNAVQVLRLIGPKEPALERQRDIIDRQVSHMGRLLEDLLEVSRITRGKIELRRQRLDLRTIIGQAIDSMRSLIDARQLKLECQTASAPLPVHGDPTRLEQILRNLIQNSIKYTEPGGCIWLMVELMEDAAQGWQAAIRVRDSGIGIAPEVLPRVFDLFAQADQSLARTQGGLGIGLTMVKRLVELHGGRIEAHSRGLGQGSEFIVRLPLVEMIEIELREVAAAKPIPVEQGGARRVLVVDDNEDAAASLGELLGLWGHEIDMVHDGPQALQAARQWRPEVILLDIGLPGMDGYEVARHLRQDPLTAGAYIVALTGYGAEEDRQRAREAGFDHHLTKPVELESLQTLLRETHEA